jgi:hypothetical protein
VQGKHSVSQWLKYVSRALVGVASVLLLVTAVRAAELPVLPTAADAPLTLPLMTPKAPEPTPVPPLPTRPTKPAKALHVAGAATLPSGVGAGRTPGQFAVSNDGSASYTIPLWAPPGIAQLQLGWALSYNSRRPDGVLGIGWSISGLSAITRCNRTWAQDGAPQGIMLTASDRFCLDGKQLKLVSGSAGLGGSTYATEIESFSQIVASGAVGNGPASFTVTTKNGLIYDYGLTADAQILAGSSGTIRTWVLSRIRDRVGNQINLTYTNDSTNGTYRIKEIDYPTTSTGQGPFYQVLFTYVPRPTNDVVSGFTAGFAVQEVNELTTITIQDYGGSVIKTYNLSYGQGAATNRLRLSAVQECSPLNCLPATTISYQDGEAGWATSATSLGQPCPTTTLVVP